MQASTTLSPTMAATPKPLDASLLPPSRDSEATKANLNDFANAIFDLTKEADPPTSGDHEVAESGKEAPYNGEDGVDGLSDGRITPVPSDAGFASHSTSTSPNPSISNGPPSTHYPLSASLSSSATLNPHPPAESGLGTLAGEEALKQALLGKDRLFLLVIGKEFEAFIGRIGRGESPNFAAINGNGTGGSVLGQMSCTEQIKAVATSKFQRMLVYKAAEWYGLRAVGLEAGMMVGLLGQMDEKSTTLRLAELVAKPPSPTQKFKIMQRGSNDGTHSPSSRAGSGAADMNGMGNGDSGPSKWKSLEEREAAYAIARERIYGKTPEREEAPDLPPSRSRSAKPTGQDDEIDPVPRRLYENGGGGAAAIQPVYASLYHLPKTEPTQQLVPANGSGATAQNEQYTSGGDSSMTYQQAMGYYPSGMTGMSYPTNGGTAMGIPYPTQQTGQVPYQMPSMPPQTMYNGGGRNGTAYISSTTPTNAYHPQVWPQQAYMPQPNVPMPQQWGYGTPQMGMGGQSGGPMPMIPQGMQMPPYPSAMASPSHQQAYYATTYHHPQQLMYPTAPLIQPTPHRPQPQPHSSASSSISSRSYQDYPSRPHSRGSTTSTRSAASSVRLGALYAAGQGVGMPGGGGRQRGLKKGEGTWGGVSGYAGLGVGERRSVRGQSPSSTTTTSSRSSRRNGSIAIAAPQPGQHQLPQRPDWAANNVPYHPSPLPPLDQMAKQGNADFESFPPLPLPPPLRAQHGTNAEPMQVERAKMRPTASVGGGGGVAAGSNGTGGAAWSGVASRTASGKLPPLSLPVGGATSPMGAQPPQPETPVDVDADFPRRSVGTKSSAALYDPSAPPSRPDSANKARGMDEIEARLAAVSVSAGVSIGPPPVVVKGGGAGGPSYARVVRRE